MQDYKKLQIWQQGMEIVSDCYKLIKLLPKDETYGISSQIKRAAVFIPSNIAEGASRRSDKDYLRFLEIALGSTFELETQLLLVKDLQLSTGSEMENLLSKIESQKKMTYGFMTKLQP